MVDRGERELHPRQVNVHRRRPPVRAASLPMALSSLVFLTASLGFLTAMVLTWGVPVHRSDVGIAGRGSRAGRHLHQKEGMLRARPVARVDP